MNDANVREKQITKTSIIGILANICLAALKAVIGLASGSIAIVLDAVNNLTDAMSSVITIVGIKLAKRKPDTNHPFGYGRIEYFSAIIISAIVLTAGVTSIIESVKKIFHPEIAEYTVVSIVIIVVAVFVKLILGKYVKSQGKKYNSDALVASGADASFDAIISVTTLVGAVVTLIFHISIDGIIGAVISVFIVKAGIEMLLESLNSVIGARPEAEVTMAIKKAVASVDGVNGAYDLVLHNYGPDSALGAVHIEVASDLTANEIHQITKAVQLKIEEEFHVFLTVGIYSVNAAYSNERAKINEIARSHQGVLNAHGVYIDETKKYASFDIMTDFTVPDKGQLVKDVAKEVADQVLEGYDIDINLDVNYSD